MAGRFSGFHRRAVHSLVPSGGTCIGPGRSGRWPDRLPARSLENPQRKLGTALSSRVGTLSGADSGDL